MDYVHFYCENCNSATPEMYNVLTISNITCIEELTRIINSNLLTYVRYDSNCKNCAKIKNELVDIDNYIVGVYFYTDCNFYYKSLCVYNNKLTKEYRIFRADLQKYSRIHICKQDNKYMYYWLEISEEYFFNFFKVGSLLIIHKSKINEINKIKEKFYEVNLIQIVGDFHYYIVESPTLTKPAIKNN